MRRSQAGNAVVFVLIGIALFAALAFTFMRGAKTGQGNMTVGQASIAAVEILDYTATVGRAVNKLRQRGCSESEINFGAAIDAWTFWNPDSPASEVCNVFAPYTKGGNITAMLPKANWYDPNPPHPASNKIFFYTDDDGIAGLGKNCAGNGGELSMNIWGISLELCNALNTKLGYDFATIPVDSLYGSIWKNGPIGCVQDSFTGPLLTGKKAVCYNDSWYGYTFNYVLIER